ncbi:MAG: hypothetical protein HQ513_10645 [Rhodospirillales bacterium]|nr:hypothetical protein [Rhodospirillales bacterium]
MEKQNQITVTLVNTAEEWEALMDLRLKIFIDEVGEPMDEQFDGNDHCSSHLLARLHGRPVGCFRIRFVSGADGGSVAWEKLGVLKEVRKSNPRIFHYMAEAALQYTRMKGIRNAIGIAANPRLLKFWCRFGFELTGEPALQYRGICYTPLRLRLTTPTEQAPDIKRAMSCEANLFAAYRTKNIVNENRRGKYAGNRHPVEINLGEGAAGNP